MERRHFARLVGLLLIALTMSVAAAAHEKKKHQNQVAPAASVTTTRVPDGNMVAPPEAMPLTDEHMAGMMGAEADERASMSKGERVLNLLGRFHPSVVHFPLAFFPAALFAALVGRRRPGFARPVRFLVIAGGVTAPIAMALGWLDGGLALSDTDPLLAVHRWLGTGIGVASAGLAIWAWKRPESDRGTGMLIGLAIITAALIVQGWYGGALVHGMSHMNW